MSTLVTDLWRELRTFLQERGELPLEHEVLTPAEIAASIRTTGDERPYQFVWDYYYPQHYGSADGEVTSDDALALVNSFAKPGELLEQTLPPDESLSADLCAICHKEPARLGTLRK